MEGGYSGVTKVKFRSETVSLVKLAVYPVSKAQYLYQGL